jgi:hypothetical protein
LPTNNVLKANFSFNKWSLVTDKITSLPAPITTDCKNQKEKNIL